MALLRRRRETAPATPGSTFLTPDLAARVRRLEIRTRRLAGTQLAGNYRSIFRGTGIEFAEAREYTPGDDVRRIDWNVTARMGTPWVKEYVEERELNLVCAVDLSASQLVARPATGRLAAAAELTALLGFAAVQNHDRAGLLTFTDRVERFVPPRHGTRHVMRMMRDVFLHDETHRGTNIGAAADYLARVLPRRSVVFVISDWLDTGFAQSLRALARRHDVTALVLIDPIDLALPDLGLVAVESAEDGTRAWLDTSDREVRERYAAAAHDRARHRHELLAIAGVDEVEVRLDADIVDPLAAYFRLRAGRR